MYFVIYTSIYIYLLQIGIRNKEYKQESFSQYNKVVFHWYFLLIVKNMLTCTKLHEKHQGTFQPQPNNRVIEQEVGSCKHLYNGLCRVWHHLYARQLRPTHMYDPILHTSSLIHRIRGHLFLPIPPDCCGNISVNNTETFWNENSIWDLCKSWKTSNLFPLRTKFYGKTFCFILNLEQISRSP